MTSSDTKSGTNGRPWMKMSRTDAKMKLMSRIRRMEVGESFVAKLSVLDYATARDAAIGWAKNPKHSIMLTAEPVDNGAAIRFTRSAGYYRGPGRKKPRKEFEEIKDGQTMFIEIDSAQQVQSFRSSACQHAAKNGFHLSVSKVSGGVLLTRMSIEERDKIRAGAQDAKPIKHERKHPMTKATKYSLDTLDEVGKMVFVSQDFEPDTSRIRAAMRYYSLKTGWKFKLSPVDLVWPGSYRAGKTITRVA